MSYVLLDIENCSVTPFTLKDSRIFDEDIEMQLMKFESDNGKLKFDIFIKVFDEIAKENTFVKCYKLLSD